MFHARLGYTCAPTPELNEGRRKDVNVVRPTQTFSLLFNFSAYFKSVHTSSPQGLGGAFKREIA